MARKIDIEYLANLPVHIDTWDSDPALENPVAEDYSFDNIAKENFNNSQLEAILGILRPGEIPVSFDIRGGESLGSYTLYMTSKYKSKTEFEIIYSRDFISLSDGNHYGGILTKYFEKL